MKKEKDSKKLVSLGTLYEFNKNIMAQQEEMNVIEINKLIPQLEQWFSMQLDEYAMLLCRERYDFTIFHLYEEQNLNPPKIAVIELIDLLKSRGVILSIEKEEDHWEIWIKIDNEAFAYYLFNCDSFVISC